MTVERDICGNLPNKLIEVVDKARSLQRAGSYLYPIFLRMHNVFMKKILESGGGVEESASFQTRLECDFCEENVVYLIF